MATNGPIQIGGGASGEYLDPLLSQFQISYVQSLKFNVADIVSPKLPVQRRTGQYVVWDAPQDFRIDTLAVRTRGSRAPLIEAIKKNGVYSCTTYALAAAIDDQEINDGEDIIDIRQRKTAMVTRHMAKLREWRVASSATDTSIITNYSTPAALWDDYIINKYADNTNYVAGNNNPYNSSTNTSGYKSNPFTDLQAAQSAVLRATGFQPTHFVIPRQVAIVLRGHPEFINRFKNWTSTVGSWDLPTPFEGMTPVVAGAYYNSANWNINDTMSLANVWGGNVVLYYVDDDQHMALGTESLTTFKTFDLTKERQTFSIYDAREHTTIVECQETIVEAVTAAPTGYILQNTVYQP